MPRNVTTTPRGLKAPITVPYNKTDNLSLDWPLTSSITPNTSNGTPAFTRASVAWYPDTSSPPIYSQSASGVIGLNADGFFTEPGRTNSCTNFNAAPVVDATVVASGGTLSVISDAAALIASGLGNICPGGNVYNFVNNSGSTQTITITSAANAGGSVSLRCFAKIPNGSTITMQTSDGAHLGALNMYPTDGLYLDFRSENIASVVANSNLVFSVPNLASFSWVLNQFEIGQNTTTPMVTAGGSFTRAVTSLTIASLTNVPMVTPGSGNDLVIYCEVLPYGVIQEASGPCFLAIYQDANNLYGLGRSVNPMLARKRAASVNYDASPRVQMQSERMIMAMRCSSNQGVDFFSNGAKGIAPILTGNPALVLTTPTIRVGAYQDGSGNFTGRIRNVRVYSAALTDQILNAMTLPQDYGIQFIPYAGPPAYDQINTGRIWSLFYNTATAKWDTIQYSDDFGGTWTLWKTLNAGTEGTSVNPNIFRCRSGNLYFGTSTDFRRIDGVTKVVTVAATFVANTNTLGTATPVTPGTIGSVWGQTNWHFTEDDAGNIYVGQYQIAAGQFGGQFMWKSPKGGSSFTRIDSLVDGTWAGTTSERHIHSMRCNPNDDSIWVSWGDGANRGTGRVTNKFGVNTQLGDVTILTDATGTKGPTGITFTPEGAWISTDNSGSQGHIKSCTDNTNLLVRYTTIQPFNITSGFFLCAYSANELWAVFTTDNRAVSQTDGIVKFTKKAGIDAALFPARVLSLDSSKQTQMGFYDMSHNNRGMLPKEWPYVFVYRRDVMGNAPNNVGTYRVKR